MSAQRDRIRLYAWLWGLLAITCVTADEGDDFSNNLFSDLSPLLALFGERVTMQFMSESMGWADNIILAMAPVGILTIIIGAIRVGGPSWLKAIIGRARENLAAAEVELMSSTSDEVCELWNGRELVRCMGSAPVVEFICLLPKKTLAATKRPRSSTILDILRKAFEYVCLLPKEDGSNTKTLPTELRGLLTRPESLGVETTKLNEVFHECGKLCTKINSCNVCRNQRVDVEAGDSSPPLESPRFSITRNPDDGSPNVSLNIHGPSRKPELVLAAVSGTILQLGVLVYAWFATYYPPLRFPKDDKSVASYAYPCTTAGTLLLVFGIAVCAHVVDSSTKEREFEAKDGREIRVVWLQQQKTVSDQSFKSCAIYAEKPQLSIKSSRRDKSHERQDQTLTEVHPSQRDANDETQSDETQSDGTQSDETKLGLEMKTLVGTAVTLSGFVLQFVGLRGMHWSISIAQLGAVLVMVIFKAWVRRRLASPPKIQKLTSGFELDWLAKTLGNDRSDYEHWGGQDGRKECSRDWIILSNEKTKLEVVNKRSDSPSQATVDVSAQRPIGDVPDNTEDTLQADPGQSCAEAILIARRELGSLADWHGFAHDEALCLSKAIEVTMNTLFNRTGSGTDKEQWKWQFLVQFDGSEQEIGLDLCREGIRWKAEIDEIDAALSLWLSSTNTEAGETLWPADFYAENKPQNSNDTASQPPKSKEKDKSQLYIPSVVRGKRSLGVSTPHLERDLAWWVPRDLLRTYKLNKDGSESLEIQSPKASRPISRDETHAGSRRDEIASPHQGDDNTGEARNANDEGQIKLLALDYNASQKLLYAQSLFSLFMRAVAEKLEDPVEGGVDELLPEYAAGGGDWKRFQLRNNTLSRLVQDVHQTGLGSLAEIYTSVVTPLSRAQKLPRIDKVIEWTRKHAEKFASLEDWQSVGNCLEWLPEVAETGSTTARAEGILMDHLRRVILLIKFQKEQHFERLRLFSLALEKLPARLEDVLVKIRSRRQVLTESHIADLTKLFEFEPKAYYSSSKPRTLLQQTELATAVESFAEDSHEFITYPKEFKIAYRHYEALRPSASNIPVSAAKDRASATAKDILDRTPAHYAAFTTYGRPFFYLQRIGAADLNAEDLLGWTPLHYACWADGNWGSSRRKQIEDLVEAGVAVDHQARDGVTPLHCAVSQGHVDRVRLLVEAGAVVDTRDFRGNTPLHLAAYRGHSDIIDILLSSGSRNSRDRFGRTALHQAALAGRKNVIDLLLSNVVFAKDLEARDRNGQTPLLLAAAENHLDCIQALLEKGADILSAGRTGRTALHWAASSGHAHFIGTLLRKGADIDSKDGGGHTPLHLAADSGHADCVRELLEKGANVRTRNNKGELPLHKAAPWDNPEMSQMLITDDGTPNQRPRLKVTPLMLAIQGGHLDVVELMVSMIDTDLEVRDKEGMTALQHAIYSECPGSIEVLIRLGADIEATGEDEMSTSKDKRLSIEDERPIAENEMTPLMSAASVGNVRAVELLLARGANVNHTIRGDRTALTFAKEKEKKEVVDILQSAMQTVVSNTG